MVTVTSETDRRAGVTYVRVRIDNRVDGAVADAHAVRLEPTVEPVWPPRRGGVPDREWDDDGVTIDVPAGTVRGIGFATPAVPDGEPVAVTGVDVASDGGSGELRARRTSSEPPTDRDDAPEPRAVLRALGDPSPPRDAVPVDDGGGGRVDGADASLDASGDDRPGDGTDSPPDARRSGSVTPGRTGDPGTERSPNGPAERAPAGREGPHLADRTDRRSGERSAAARAPAPVERWLGAIERRIATAEGEPGAEAALAADAAHLRRVAARAERLAERADRRLGEGP